MFFEDEYLAECEAEYSNEINEDLSEEEGEHWG